MVFIMHNSYRIYFYIMRGSLIWNTQRYSSLLILSYIIYVATFIIFNNDINFYSWSNFFLSFKTRIFTTLISIMIVIHAYIGLWTVGTDYLTSRTLGFLNKSLSKRANLLRYVYFFGFGILGILYLMIILYIIWL